jgi:hypothetical protein
MKKRGGEKSRNEEADQAVVLFSIVKGLRSPPDPIPVIRGLILASRLGLRGLKTQIEFPKDSLNFLRQVTTCCVFQGS